MSYKGAPQKLISFTESQADLDRITEDMNNGWTIISLVRNGNYYVGIMEQKLKTNDDRESAPKLFIPPRKKIKITG